MKKPAIPLTPTPRTGTTPAVVLVRPKFAHNVGAAVRAASCFGVSEVWYTGGRIEPEIEARGRLPREERMKGYREVSLIRCDKPLDRFQGAVPVAVELRERSEPLPSFAHPERAVYVFGPEDGGLTKPICRLCHRFVVVPSRHCLNLAAAVYLVLYDRAVKRWRDGFAALPSLDEERGPTYNQEV